MRFERQDDYLILHNLQLSTKRDNFHDINHDGLLNTNLKLTEDTLYNRKYNKYVCVGVCVSIRAHVSMCICV